MTQEEFDKLAFKKVKDLFGDGYYGCDIISWKEGYKFAIFQLKRIYYRSEDYDDFMVNIDKLMDNKNLD